MHTERTDQQVDWDCKIDPCTDISRRVRYMFPASKLLKHIHKQVHTHSNNTMTTLQQEKHAHKSMGQKGFFWKQGQPPRRFMMFFVLFQTEGAWESFFKDRNKCLFKSGKEFNHSFSKTTPAAWKSAFAVQVYKQENRLLLRNNCQLFLVREILAPLVNWICRQQFPPWEEITCTCQRLEQSNNLNMSLQRWCFPKSYFLRSPNDKQLNCPPYGASISRRRRLYFLINHVLVFRVRIVV